MGGQNGWERRTGNSKIAAVWNPMFKTQIPNTHRNRVWEELC